jgi:hypothetical protein
VRRIFCYRKVVGVRDVQIFGRINRERNGAFDALANDNRSTIGFWRVFRYGIVS